MLAQVFFQLQIEIRRVHADKQWGLHKGEALLELPADADYLAVAQQNVQTKSVH